MGSHRRKHFLPSWVTTIRKIAVPFVPMVPGVPVVQSLRSIQRLTPVSPSRQVGDEAFLWCWLSPSIFRGLVAYNKSNPTFFGRGRTHEFADCVKQSSYLLVMTDQLLLKLGELLCKLPM